MVNKNSFGLIWVVVLFILVVVGSSVSAFSFNDLFLFSSGSFSVFQTNAPNITDTYVAPVKVVPGDVMTVSAEVSDDYGVSSVSADMGGIEVIPLFLEKGTVYAGLWHRQGRTHPNKLQQKPTCFDRYGKAVYPNNYCLYDRMSGLCMTKIENVFIVEEDIIL